MERPHLRRRDDLDEYSSDEQEPQLFAYYSKSPREIADFMLNGSPFITLMDWATVQTPEYQEYRETIREEDPDFVFPHYTLTYALGEREPVMVLFAFGRDDGFTRAMFRPATWGEGEERSTANMRKLKACADSILKKYEIEP